MWRRKLFRMEPLERRILYFHTIAASTPQKHFHNSTDGFKPFVHCSFRHLIVNRWTIWTVKVGPSETASNKNNGVQVIQPAPRTNEL